MSGIVLVCSSIVSVCMEVVVLVVVVCFDVEMV